MASGHKRTLLQLWRKEELKCQSTISQVKMRDNERKRWGEVKAWLIRQKGEFCAEVVFAETRGKARALATHADICDYADFIDVEAHRLPKADKYYKEGKWHLDWEVAKDRIALVKDCGFVCDPDYLEWEDCESCSAKDYCDRYHDHKESEDTE